MLASCDGTSASPTRIDPGDGGNYDPYVDTSSFVERIDNPYMPLTPGSRWVYESDDGTERNEVVVLEETRDVMGITATVVHDTAYEDGEIVEDTFDWFAQDAEGNVWYLGEDTHEYEDGKPVNSAGAWEAGIDGAKPGIVMLANPQVGASYRQEYYEGEAEDMGKVLRLGASGDVPAGAYDAVLVTEDWTPLEPEVVEQKYYAPGVGLIAEEKVAGGEGRVELVEYVPAP